MVPTSVSGSDRAQASTHHDDRRHDPEDLLDDGPGVDHIIEQFQGEGRINIVSSNPVLLFPDLRKYFWVIGSELEHIDDRARHGVLTGKEERQDDHRDFVIRVFSAEKFGLLAIAILSASGCHHRLSPLINETFRLCTGLSHLRFRRRGCRCQVPHDMCTSFASVVDLRAGEGEGEVDEFESDGDEPVPIIDLLLLSRGDIGANEDAE